MFTHEDLANMIKATVQAVLQQGPRDPWENVAKLKLKDPEKFDGKPTSPFTSWW